MQLFAAENVTRPCNPSTNEKAPSGDPRGQKQNEQLLAGQSLPPYADSVNKATEEFIARFVHSEPTPPAPATGRHIHLENAAEILKDAPMEWRVKGVLPATGVAVMYGASGSGKSFVMLNLAAHIAQGESWFGCRVKVAPVVYVNLESSGGLRNRIAAWETENGLSFPSGVQFVRHTVRIREDVDALAAVIPQGAVTVIDTLHAAAPDMDENSSKDMGECIAEAGRLAKLTKGLVVLIHHTGKDQARGARGHYSLTADTDTVIRVERSGNRRSIIMEKVKEGEDGKRLDFYLKPVSLGTDEDDDTVFSMVALQDVTRANDSAGRETGKPLTASLQYGLDTLRDAMTGTAGTTGTNAKCPGNVPVHLETWRQYFYVHHTGDSAEAKKKAFQRARKSLVERGLIEVDDDMYFIPETTGTPGQGRDINGTCPAASGTGTTGTPPLRGVPVCPADVSRHMPEQELEAL